MNKAEKERLKTNKTLTTVGIVLIITAFGLMVHQYVIWSHGWEWDDVLHHEVFAICFVFIAIILFTLRKKDKRCYKK